MTPPARKPRTNQARRPSAKAPNTLSGGPSTTRERILQGMARGVARHGYADATVAHVLEYGNVGRATFYEHFVDKEDCFLAAVRATAERATVALHDTLRRATEQDGLRHGPRAMLLALLEEVERHPDDARLLLIEALAAGPSVRAERVAMMDDAERSIERVLDEHPGELPTVDLPTRALLGGVLGVIAMRVLHAETGGLTDLADDLLAWIGSYAVPAGSSRHELAAWLELGRGLASEPDQATASGERAQRPRGRRSLSESLARREHRERILRAVASTVSANGYAAVTVADIVAAAQISRNVFYAHFRSKQEAYAAAQTVGLRQLIAVTSSGFASGETWPERVWAGLTAFYGYLADEPEFARMEAIESYTAGPAAIQRRYDSQLAFNVFVEDGYRQRPESAPLPRLCSEAIGAAVAELSYRELYEGRAAEAMELVPLAVYVALAPFLGPQEAWDFVDASAHTSR
jgi:AcrR family transcriptional regulator